MPISDLDGSFTFQSFIEHLKIYHNKTNEEIRILAYITDLRREELFGSMERFGFDVTNHGLINEVKITNRGRWKRIVNI
jgi:hypothetical protein